MLDLFFGSKKVYYSSSNDFSFDRFSSMTFIIYKQLVIKNNESKIWSFKIWPSLGQVVFVRF
jgi:hypothetical protein